MNGDSVYCPNAKGTAGKCEDPKCEICYPDNSLIEKISIDGLSIEKRVKYIPYQRCPICKGLGVIPFTPQPGITYIKTDTEICSVCNGNKIIPMHEIVEIIEGKVDTVLGNNDWIDIMKSKCKKPNCQCASFAEYKNKGQPVKDYPCLMLREIIRTGDG